MVGPGLGGKAVVCEARSQRNILVDKEAAAMFEAMERAAHDVKVKLEI
jgi:hypothetical protein